MTKQEPAQSFENHARIVPMYHRVLFGMLMLHLVWTIYQAARGFSLATLEAVMLAVALVLSALFARVFALRVQDRVIRNEELFRMRETLPEDMRARIGEFTIDQLVALRFASDTELADLARRVLDEEIRDRKSIKRMVREWRPDHARA
jgi:hypothetical protein